MENKLKVHFTGRSFDSIWTLMDLYKMSREYIDSMWFTNTYTQFAVSFYVKELLVLHFVPVAVCNKLEGKSHLFGTKSNINQLSVNNWQTIDQFQINAWHLLHFASKYWNTIQPLNYPHSLRKYVNFFPPSFIRAEQINCESFVSCRSMESKESSEKCVVLKICRSWNFFSILYWKKCMKDFRDRIFAVVVVLDWWHRLLAAC